MKDRPTRTHRKLYAIANPHGCLDVLKRALSAVDLSGNSHLFLLGDYVPHEWVWMGPKEYAARSTEALEFVRVFQAEHPGKVSVLPGNHELWLLDKVRCREIGMDRELLRWLQSLPPYLETERQIFVHAGVDEEAGASWRIGYDAEYFCGKYPPAFGAFEKDIVAGHVGVQGLAEDDGHQGVFWDGQSHYYLDATTEQTGMINILIFDEESGRYSQRIATADAVSEAMPIEAFWRACPS